LLTPCFFQGRYDEALAIYRQNWTKPFNGKTFDEITLEDVAEFDKAGLTNPDLSRMKQHCGYDSRRPSRELKRSFVSGNSRSKLG